MIHKRLFWQISPPFLLVIVIALMANSWLFSGALDDFSRQEVRRGLESQGALVVQQVLVPLDNNDLNSIDSLIKRLGLLSGTRFTVILPSGVVVADSEKLPKNMDNHFNRQEVQVALKGGIGESIRYSDTLKQEMVYVAMPVVVDHKTGIRGTDSVGGSVIGCVRAALPVASITQTLQSVLYKVVNSGIVIAVIAALISLWLVRILSNPLEEMKRGVERFSRGELDQRLPAYWGEELGGLSNAMNQMAAQLSDRIGTEIRQRNEQDAVLASMIEGVLAIDNTEHILRLNRAAAILLDIDQHTAVGKSIREVIRKPDLHQFIAEALSSQTRIDADMTLQYQGEVRSLQVHGTPLCGADGQKIGALIVVHDVTRLRRLENLRRDFVGNVSHELKTPITAIKGAVETLLAGANENPQDSQRFLEIASRQTDRLGAIIEDLLSLSRLEVDAESEGIDRERESLQPILESALQTCARNAEAKEVQVRLFCSDQLTARVNATLLEQAVVNLLDNAIKYSGVDSIVTIEGWQEGGQAKIKVHDRGQGIPSEHLPRLFERFYRVDAARSRAIGGTGLGLAIVKHIIQAHNGEVTVHSTLGEGTIFLISLPVS